MIHSLYGRAWFSDRTRMPGVGWRSLGPPVILAVCFLWRVPLFSQEVRTISPEEAVDLAVKNNLSLESSRISTATKKRKADTAWNVFIPTVDIGGSLGRLNEKPVATVLPLPDTMGGHISMGGGYQWRLSGSLQIALNLNFALLEGMRNLRLEYESGLITYEKSVPGPALPGNWPGLSLPAVLQPRNFPVKGQCFLGPGASDSRISVHPVQAGPWPFRR